MELPGNLRRGRAARHSVAAAEMEVITAVDHLAGLLTLPRDKDDKKAERQALAGVSLAKLEAQTLPEVYLSQQGPPYSSNGRIPAVKIEGIPILDKAALPVSLWKRLAMSLSSFLSLSGWLASTLDWQRTLNPKSRELLDLLGTAQRHSEAISSNLGFLLGQENLAVPSPPTFTQTFLQKAAGYSVCKSYCDWLTQTERDLTILVAESPV